MIEVTQATPSQLPIIQKIAHDTWPHTFGEILSAAQIAYMLDWMYSLSALEQQITEAGHVFLLAKDTEQAQYVGYASYETNYQQAQKAKVHKIYILPTCQGKGVGQALMNIIQEQATQYGNHTLTLNVNRNNKAVTFYQKMGFAVVSTENIPIGEGFWMEDYVMEKRLG